MIHVVIHEEHGEEVEEGDDQAQENHTADGQSDALHMNKYVYK
jgi:hypothetical protein